MLITVNRDNYVGLLMQGVRYGIHWRAVRDVRNGINDGRHTESAAYLQFFIDAAAFRCEGRCIGISDIPPRYNAAEFNGHGLVASTTSEYYDGLPEHYTMQWIELYYGSSQLSLRSGACVSATMFAAWYPRNRDKRYISVLPSTFQKYIRPSAEYMCNYLSLIGDD